MRDPTKGPKAPSDTPDLIAFGPSPTTLFADPATWDGPVSDTGRPLPRWVVELPWVMGHYIVDVDPMDPAITAFTEGLDPGVEDQHILVRQWYRGRVYAVRNVSEETWATLAAWYSRSPHTLRENLRRAIAGGEMPLPEYLVCGVHTAYADGTTPAGSGPTDVTEPEMLRTARSRLDDKARAFHSRWTVGYGHGSVAEHANISVCFDGCSLWAAKRIEDARIGVAYTEKSTRYVPFDDIAQAEDDLWVQPAELGLHAEDPTAVLYLRAMRTWFGLYRSAVARLTEAVKTQEGVTPETSPAALRGWVLDRARDFLPLGARTGLAMTINARALAKHIQRLGARTETIEVRYLAALLTAVGRKVCPSLIRHTEPRDEITRAGAVQAVELPRVRRGTPSAVSSEMGLGSSPSARDLCEPRLIHLGGHLAQSVYRETLAPTEPYGWPRLNPPVDVPEGSRGNAAVEAWSTTRGPHEGLSRAAESVYVAFAIPLSLGAWRDVQRHRKLSHYRFPTPSIADGFAHDPLRYPGCNDFALIQRVVDGVRLCRALEALGGVEDSDSTDELGFVSPVESMTAARGAALYTLPLVTRVVPVIGGTLRAWAQFVELRSKREGHDEYRRVAQSIGNTLQGQTPGLRLRIDHEPRTFARK